MNIRLLLLFFIFMTAGLSGFTHQILEPKDGTHLISKSRVYSDGEIQALPEFSQSALIKDRIIAHDTVFLTEITWIMPPLPEEYEDIEQLASLFSDVEALEGIEYWSGGRNRMYPYISKSYRTSSVGNRNYLSPLEWREGSKSMKFIQYQKDTSFGSNWYDVTLRLESDSILMTTMNLTELKAFTKKTQDAGGVLFQMVVIPKGVHTVMYCAVAFKEFPPIGWGKSAVSGSFDHRISAIQAWFADTVFGKRG